VSYNIKKSWHYTKIVHFVSAEKTYFSHKVCSADHFSSLFQTVKCHDNGVHPPTFPRGGTCVLSGIPFQDGARRSAVVCRSSKMIYYAEMHRHMVEKLTWLKGTYHSENPSIRLMFVTFQYYSLFVWYIL
jgi:hypothetical protein